MLTLPLLDIFGHRTDIIECSPCLSKKQIGNHASSPQDEKIESRPWTHQLKSRPNPSASAYASSDASAVNLPLPSLPGDAVDNLPLPPLPSDADAVDTRDATIRRSSSSGRVFAAWIEALARLACVLRVCVILLASDFKFALSALRLARNSAGTDGMLLKSQRS